MVSLFPFFSRHYQGDRERAEDLLCSRGEGTVACVGVCVCFKIMHRAVVHFVHLIGSSETDRDTQILSENNSDIQYLLCGGEMHMPVVADDFVSRCDKY